MVWNGGATTIRMPVLHMGTSLAQQHETQRFEKSTNLPGFQDGNPTHTSPHLNHLCSHKLRIQRGFTILEKHPNDLLEVLLQFVEGTPLGMGTLQSGNVAHIQPGLRATLDDSGETSHEPKVSGGVRDVQTPPHPGIFPGQQLDVFLEGRERP